MPRYQLIVEYDGTPYAGWQVQDDRPTVQGELERAAREIAGEAVTVHGAGRTDAGVHATAQAAHLELPKELPAYNVMQALNFHLFNRRDASGTFQPDETCRIAVLRASLVTEEFHARFSAKKRHYLYRIINRRARLGLEANRAWHVPEELNLQAMQAGAKHLLGHHDFTSFRDTMCQAKSPEKTLDTLELSRHGDEVRVITSARSFLHHQVRIMVGTLAHVGRGKWSPDDVKKALAAKSRDAAGPTAPADGLYLTSVEY